MLTFHHSDREQLTSLCRYSFNYADPRRWTSGLPRRSDMAARRGPSAEPRNT